MLKVMLFINGRVRTHTWVWSACKVHVEFGDGITIPAIKGNMICGQEGCTGYLSYTDHTDLLLLFLFSMQVYNLFVYMSVYLGRLGSLKKGLHFLHLHIPSNLPMPSIHQGLSRCLSYFLVHSTLT